MSDSSPLAEQSSTSTDTVLVSSVLDGDAHAFERLMRQHNRRLFRVARSILQDDAEAEDAVQEGYIQAYRALETFRGESRLSTWLTRIVVNQSLERRRRRKIPAGSGDEAEALAEGSEAPPLETPEALAMRSELRRFIEMSIDGLPEMYRSVFILRAVEGLSVEETAISLGITQATTKVRFLRARAQLREALGQRLGPVLESVFSFDGHRCDRIVARVCARLGLAVPSLPGSGEVLSPAS